ncbi:MAG: serine hydrolase, partial [Actinobacteria bacterium]|nr:serine hydrolase [Actinomycetota bacterium]
MTKIATDPNFAPTPAQLLATALAGNTAITADGHYSNRNYILLGLILEKVMSKPANEQVNALLATVGMTNSAMPPPGDNTIPTPASVGYNREGGVAELAGTGVKAGPAVDNISNWGWTAGSAYSNVNDLAAG